MDTLGNSLHSHTQSPSSSFGVKGFMGCVHSSTVRPPNRPAFLSSFLPPTILCEAISASGPVRQVQKSVYLLQPSTQFCCWLQQPTTATQTTMFIEIPFRTRQLRSVGSRSTIYDILICSYNIFAQSFGHTNISIRSCRIIYFAINAPSNFTLPTTRNRLPDLHSMYPVEQVHSALSGAILHLRIILPDEQWDITTCFQIVLEVQTHGKYIVFFFLILCLIFRLLQQ